ncbi:hypothetical protein MKX01_020482, partial [Papaver californicum]
MLRPNYPQIYHRNQTPDTCDISEMIAIVDGTWKVGDMVDWLTDGCYCKELRPSLDWTPELGWTMPVSE